MRPVASPAGERRFIVTTNSTADLTADPSPDRIERLDEEIITLLARRRAMAQELPPPRVPAPSIPSSRRPYGR